MEFITHNNVLIKGHNRLVRIPSKNGVVLVKAYEAPSVGGSTIHLMLGKTMEKECMGGYGMLCVMCVLDEFEPKEVTNLVNSPKCLKRVLDEFSDVMPKELPDELPSRRRINHAIEVMIHNIIIMPSSHNIATSLCCCNVDFFIPQVTILR
jgi:hypothetical protein